MRDQLISKNQNTAEFSFLKSPRKVITKVREGQYCSTGDLELGNYEVIWERTFDERGRPLEWKFFEDSALNSVLEYSYEGEECVVIERDNRGKVVKTTTQRPFSVTVRDGNHRVALPDSVPVSGLIANLKHEFDFDSEGNWVKHTATTTVASSRVVHIAEREITYW
jgi:hypothetical protein